MLKNREQLDFLNKYMKDENQQILDMSIFQGLEEGEQEWVNIQPIVRNVIHYFLQLFSNQAVIIENLKNKTSLKLDQDQYQNEKKDFAQTLEIKNLIHILQTKTDEKVDKCMIRDELEQKVSQKQFNQQIYEIKDLMIQRMQQYALNEQLNEQIKQFQQLGTRQDDLEENLKSKISKQELKQVIEDEQTQVDSLKEELGLISLQIDRVRNQVNTKAEKDDIIFLEKKCASKNQFEILQKNQEHYVSKNELENQITEMNAKKVDKEVFDSIIQNQNLKIQKFDKENFCLKFEKINETCNLLKQDIVKNQNGIQLVKKEIMNNDKQYKTQMGLLINQSQLDAVIFQHQKDKQYSQEIFDAFRISLNQIQKEYEEKMKKLSEEIFKVQDNDFKNIMNQISEINKQINLNQTYLKDTIQQYQKEFELNLTTYKEGLDKLTKQNEDQHQFVIKRINSLTQNISLLNQNSLTKNAFDIFKKQTKKEIQLKCDVEEVQQAINGCNKNYSELLDQLQKSFISKNKEIMKEILNKIRLCVSKNELKQKMENYLDKNESLENHQTHSQSLKEHEKRLDMNELKIHSLEDQIQNDKQIETINQQILKTQSKLKKKISLEQVEKFMSDKADKEQVKQQIERVKSKIDDKVSKNDLNVLMEEQSQFNQFFCTEFIVARYKWKTGILLENQIVPFNVEVVNTLKQNYLWSKNSGKIGIVNGGLYDIKVGFFGQKIPQIKIILNGKIMYQSSVNSKQSKVSDFSNIGETKQIFLMVQDNSSIQVQCVGELVNEGFIDLKRM